MSQEITHNNKELFFDFFLFKNKYKENLDYLDDFILSLKINNINKLSDLEGFFKNTILKQTFLCLVDDKTNTVGLKNSKNGQKEVFNFLLRFEFSEVYQSRLPQGCCLAFGADIDPNRAVINVKNIFITKMVNNPQEFESVIKNCRSRVIALNNEISNEELLERNVLNSQTVSNINKLLTNFENEALAWNNYLDYLSDILEVKRRLALPYLNGEVQNYIKVENKDALGLKQKALEFLNSSNYKYFDFIYHSEFIKNKINFEIINILSFDIVDSSEFKNFERIKKMEDLFLLPISANKNVQNLTQSKNNIKKILDFNSLGENSIRIENKIQLEVLLGTRKKGSLIDYWKVNSNTILGAIPSNSKDISDLDLMDKLSILEVFYEISDYDFDFKVDNDLIRNLENGYLAYLGIGDETIINRSRKIINRIRNGWVKNPYLANYLFNTDSIVVNTSNQEFTLDNVEFYYNLNHLQKVAVIKALNSKDIFLLQGPPGTGKTQVISEIVYQLANRKNKVLISSQNHEAINNVIERLPIEPDLYKMRLSNVSFLENKSVNKYAPERLLLNHYQSIGKVAYDNLFQNGADLNLAKNELINIENLLVGFESIQIKRQELDKISEKITVLEQQITKSFEDLNPIFHNLEDIEEDIFQTENMISNIKNENYQGVISNNKLIIDSYNKVLKKNLESLFVKLKKTPGENIFKNISFIWNHFITNNEKFIDLLKLKNDLNSASILGDYEKVIINRNKINDLEFEIENDKIISNLKIILDRYVRELQKKLDSLSSKNDNNLEKAKKNSINVEINNLMIDRNKIRGSISEMLGPVQAGVEKFNRVYREELDISDKNSKQIIEQKIKELDKKIDDFEKNKNRLKPLYEKSLNFLKNNYEISCQDENKIEKNRFNFQLINDTKKYLPIITQNLTNIYAMTLNSPNQFFFDKNKLAKSVGLEKIDLNNLNIDTVIIDEASKATLLEIIMPLVFGHSLILVGDYRQLPPLIKITQKEVDFINSETNKNYDYEEIFNLLNDSIFKRLITNANSTIKETLQYQYRSNRQIMDVVNNFYDGYLKIDEETDLKKFHNLKVSSSIGNPIITPETSTYWIDSSVDLKGEWNLEKSEEYSTSFYNKLEAELTIEMIKKIDRSISENIESFSETPTLAIICMYGLQVNKIKKIFSKIRNEIKNLKIIISTVDDFQGKECDFVIVNMVRNPEKVSTNGQKFIKQYERINVALSRARKLLIIVGSSRTTRGVSVKIPDMDKPNQVRTTNVYDDIISYIKFNNGYKTAKDIYE
ncbi:AAA domain-containing protein [Spiroplasma alleghenense]|uniref:Superfamily I DNA/RNA helicase n=1 Tax=Spiroplasma alleghenense TaxID=216931 RepID=A0A345Z365_9MOLU|nr:AAA domain-containing protein [Spiroplasma alleghenense]AXK51044.1 superfamily I DNA/RNA helicase [Spiroplasma alleghenense]